MKVRFFNLDRSPNIRQKTKLKNFVESIFVKENKSLESINYIFCSDKELLKINQQYLNHDFYTDVITFDLSHKKNQIIGEVYVSYDRIVENSRGAKNPIYLELQRVIFHAALHLCGYDDKTPKEISKIRSLENMLLNKFNNI